MTRKETAVWIAAGAGAAATALLILGLHHWRPRWSIVQGAVIQRDSDVRKQKPIAGAEVIASYRGSSLSARSSPSGYFHIAFPAAILPGQTVTLRFQHPGYKTLQLPITIPFRSSLRQLIVAAMQPTAEAGEDASIAPTVVSNIRVRYTVNAEKEESVGSEARTFVVANKPNIPCRRQAPCSPDGYWKAAAGSIQLDAGAGNEFRNARALCIAGPCPFTKIDASGFARGGRIITASAFVWSSTATFLLQAEVVHTTSISEGRESYPVVYDRGFNFSVPPSAEGVSLAAELEGFEIIFPLSPNLEMSWASCTVNNGPHAIHSSFYRCELKPGYRF